MLYSTVTARAQTTLPNGVRKALGISPGDRIVYAIEGDQAVIRRHVEGPDDDPVIGAFLDFLEREMIRDPGRLQPVTPELMAKMQRLSAGIEVDLDEEIEGPVAL